MKNHDRNYSLVRYIGVVCKMDKPSSKESFVLFLQAIFAHQLVDILKQYMNVLTGELKLIAHQEQFLFYHPLAAGL